MGRTRGSTPKEPHDLVLHRTAGTLAMRQLLQLQVSDRGRHHRTDSAGRPVGRRRQTPRRSLAALTSGSDEAEPYLSSPSEMAARGYRLGVGPETRLPAPDVPSLGGRAGPFHGRRGRPAARESCRSTSPDPRSLVLSASASKTLFSLKTIFLKILSHQILQHMYKILNIDKNKN